MSKNSTLQQVISITPKDARKLHVETLLQSCKVAQKQGASRQSLAAATYLSDLVPICAKAGIQVEAAVQEVVADILWAQGERGTSIRMLQQLSIQKQAGGERGSVQKSTILAKLVSTPTLYLLHN